MAKKKAESKKLTHLASTQKESLTEKPKKKRKNSRAKGANFERDVTKLLNPWWGCDFHRVPASGGLHWKDDNRVSGDVVAPPNANFPFNIECKKHEGWNFEQVIKGTGDVVDWWEQCTRDAGKFDQTPLLVFSKNRSPIYFMVRYEDFVTLSDNDSYFTTNYLITTITLADGELECVGIGIFDSLTEINKDKVIELLSKE